MASQTADRRACRSIGSTSRPTRCRPTPRSRTAPTPGTRRRWSWSRPRPAAGRASATPTPTRRRRALIRDLLAGVVKGRDAMGVPGAWSAMVAAIRNLGRPGHRLDGDLRRRRRALGPEGPAARPAAGHAARRRPRGGAGLRQRRVHLVLDRAAPRAARRLGRRGHPAGQDEDRPPPGRRPRAASGPPARRSGRTPSCSSTPTAPTAASRPWPWPSAFAELGVTWFEEPVSSDDLDGLRLLRDRAPAGMDIAAGEYGYDLFYFRRMLEAGAVDVLQADATRCGGITGFLARRRRSARRAALPLLGPLRPVAARPPELRPAGLPPPRVFPRPRPDRAHALRRRPDPGRRRAAPRPVPPRAGPRIQAPGRGPVRRLKRPDRTDMKG